MDAALLARVIGSGETRLGCAVAAELQVREHTTRRRPLREEASPESRRASDGISDETLFLRLLRPDHGGGKPLRGDAFLCRRIDGNGDPRAELEVEPLGA